MTSLDAPTQNVNHPPHLHVSLLSHFRRPEMARCRNGHESRWVDERGLCANCEIEQAEVAHGLPRGTTRRIIGGAP